MSNLKLNIRPKCQVPGCNKLAQNTNTTKNPKWRKSSWVTEKYNVEGYVCSNHHFTKIANNNGFEKISSFLNTYHPYKKYRKTYCENIDGRLGFKCTTTIVDPEWQLDADHIDGNPTNNDAKNIQTLCKCCHAIKTRDEKDYLTAGRKTLKVA